MKELIAIQSELKVNKDLYNAFGKYKYRSCESILEALKPLLKKYECYLLLTDEIVNIGDRFYVKATAVLKKDNADHQGFQISAYAREELSKKGMDSSQVTGATSSYARKYALNGLFLIDDAKDSDTTNNGTQTSTQTSAPSTQGKVDDDKVQSAIVAAKTLDALKAQWKYTADGSDNRKLLEDKIKSHADYVPKK